MKIASVQSLAIPEVKVVRFQRFKDHRGYFSETFRSSDFLFIPDFRVVQANESFSLGGVCRGLHFQWNPYMGKLVRTVRGHMVDLVLDIRKGSPTLGKILAYDMPANHSGEFSEWIWVPPGFAHGNFFLEDTTIEYLCTGEHSPGCEAGICPTSKDIDWSLVSQTMENLFLAHAKVMSPKDAAAPSLFKWLLDPRSEEFQYEALK